MDGGISSRLSPHGRSPPLLTGLHRVIITLPSADFESPNKHGCAKQQGPPAGLAWARLGCREYDTDPFDPVYVDSAESLEMSTEAANRNLVDACFKAVLLYRG